LVKNLEQEQLLKVKDLVVHFYTLDGVVRALENVSFNIGKSENFGLAGESGCGKSTTGLTILRILPQNAVIESGSINFNGLELLGVTEKHIHSIRGREISMIFQDPYTSLNPLFTVGEQLCDVLETHFKIKEKRELKKKAIDALQDAQMPSPEGVFDMYPHELSGGMQQRAIIAIALSTKPKLLIADEPTTMLDITTQGQILDLITELKKTLGLSILLITHNLGIIAEMCDKLAIMYAGTIVERGSVEQVLESQLHPYTCGLMKAVPKIAKRKSRLTHIPGVVPSLINPPSGCRFHPRCPYVIPECKSKSPSVVEVEKGHSVACYRYIKC